MSMYVMYVMPRCLRLLYSKLSVKKIGKARSTLRHLFCFVETQKCCGFWHRLLISPSRYDRITPLLIQLHWLNVPKRIEFKLAGADIQMPTPDSSAVPR